MGKKKQIVLASIDKSVDELEHTVAQMNRLLLDLRLRQLGATEEQYHEFIEELDGKTPWAKPTID